MKIKISDQEDLDKVSIILLRNGYKVWQSEECVVDMGGMAGSRYDNYLHLELLNPTEGK